MSGRPPGARPGVLRAVVVLAVLAMVLSLALAAVSSAQAAVASTVSLGVSPSWAAPAESVVLSGVVSPVASGRTVSLQRYGTSWTTVATATTGSTGRFSGSVKAGLAGSKTAWRAVAVATAAAAQAVSATRALTVVKQSVSLSAPASVETGLAFTVSGVGYPARVGRTIVVQRLSGTTWVEVGRAVQSSTGSYSARTSVGSAVKFTYRAVASAWHGAAAVVSASRVVSAHSPYLLLAPSSAIAAETVKVSGKLPGVYSRVVWVQRWSGTAWVSVAKATTSTAGSYSGSFKAPAIGSYSVRAWAPQVTVAGKVKAQYVSAAKVLRVVAQTASLTMPATLVQGKTGVATAKFTPVRAGRAVTMQVWRAGAWALFATGKQSATGAMSLTMTAGVPGSYTYRAFTSALAGAPAISTPTRTVKVTAPALGKISGKVTDAGGLLHGLAGVQVNVSSYSLSDRPNAATTKADGSYTVSGLAPGTDYVVCFAAARATGGSSDATGYIDECYDDNPWWGASTPVTVTPGTTTVGIDAALAVGGAVSGTVTEAAGIRHGLANVSVSVASPSGFGYATTAADGRYTVKGLADGPSYTVCFTATGPYPDGAAGGATGGASDATGYLEQCSPTRVAVTSGATSAGVNAALAVGGAISGTVIDAGGTLHGLANVQVYVNSTSTNAFGFAKTAANGSYSVKGLAAGADYMVCVDASGATGGSSDARGYVDECFNNQPTSGTPTPVRVTVGATRAGVNARLAGAGAIGGTVTDAGGTHHGLSGVGVFVDSVSSGSGFATTAADGSYTVRGLAAGADYTVCFFSSDAKGGSSDLRGYLDECHNNKPTQATATKVAVALGATRAVSAALVGAGAISGTVTDAGGTHHGLANVSVYASSASANDAGSAATAANGSYTVTGLRAGVDYKVCFFTDGATGGSTDARGYLAECYNNRATTGTSTPVTVTLGATKAGISAALAPSGAISGKVTDAAGAGLDGVTVHVSSASKGVEEDFWTAPDGTYTVTGLPTGADYKVCFNATYASGGSSVLGYAGECFNNQPTTGTPTPVSVTVTMTRTGINAALAPAGAISGKVTDAAGTHQGLEFVGVQIISASTGAEAYAGTDTEGNYTVTGLAAGADYTVCFDGSTASGGSSDASGYVAQCWQDQPALDTATPVAVTSATTRAGIDAALVGNP